MSEALSFTELESTATPQTSATAATTEDTTKAAASATTSTATVEDSKPQFTQTDVEAYQQLVAMGITPQNAEQFKLAKTAMDNLPMLMKQNPDALLDEIQKNDPALHDEFITRVSDRWFEQKGKREYESMQRKNGNGSRVADSEPAKDPDTEKMKREWEQFKSQQATENANKEAERVNIAYNKALDALVEKLPENVPEDKREHIRLKAEKLMWQDSEARGRIQKGVFTDVPKYFAEASKRVTAETKTAATKEHEARQRVEAAGTKTIIPAAENVAGASKETAPGADPVWGDITKEEIERAYK